MYTSSSESKTVWTLKNAIFEKFQLSGRLRHSNRYLHAKFEPDPFSDSSCTMTNRSVSRDKFFYVNRITDCSNNNYVLLFYDLCAVVSYNASGEESDETLWVRIRDNVRITDHWCVPSGVWKLCLRCYSHIVV